MKIGIATLSHNNSNYGGTLQSIALQEYLKLCGHEVMLLNTDHGVSIPWVRSHKDLFSHPLRKIQENRRYNTFIKFWEKHYAFDPKGFRPFEEFASPETGLDAVVCGSDQVWAPGNVNNPATRNFYMLNFGEPHLRRIAYAASLGANTFPEDSLEAIQSCLKRFTAIGLRESAAVPEVEKLGVNAEWVCDPTLLHDATFWAKYADESLPYPSENVLVQLTYRWKTEHSIKKVRTYLENEKKMRTVIPFSHQPIQDFCRTQPLTPAQWLKAIQSASFVLTNSYHGMLFAIQFKRPFIVLPLTGRYAGMNTRLFAVVERLGLTHRVLANDTPEGIAQCAFSPIDWDDVYTRLNAWRESSKRFLENALSAD